MNDRLNILLLEDDLADAEILERELEHGGIEFTLQRVETEADFTRGLAEFNPDVVLADYALPLFDGMSALKIVVEKFPETPFIFISGTIGEEFAVETLKNGATDYVMKGRLSRLPSAVERAMAEKKRRIELRHADETLRKAEEKFRMLVERMPAMIYLAALDEKFTALYISPQVEEMLGFTPRECIETGEFWYRQLHPDDRDRVVAELKGCVNEGKPFKFEYRMVKRNGEARWFHDENVIIRDRAGNPLYLEGVNFDITELRHAQEEMRKLSAVVQQNPDMVIVFNVDGSIEYVNRSAETITGYAKNEMVGTTREDIKIEQFSESQFHDVWDMLRSDKTYEDIIQYRKKSGETIHLHMMLSPLKDEGGKITHVIARGRDITEKKLIEEKLAYMVNYDPLTGLPNRSLFMDRLGQAITRTISTARYIAVLIITIDRFKMIYDAYGSKIGDEILKEAANRIRNSVRNGDTPARLGTDDFAVVLYDVAQPDDIVLVANKMQKSFAEPFLHEGTRILFTASMGIAIYPEDGANAQELVKNADVANSQANKDGGNCFRYFTGEMNAKASEFIFMEKHLYDALNKREYVLHYQPYYEAETGKIAGFESLIRWNSRELGMVPPLKFISVLEETGMIIPVGAWIIKSACETAKRWIMEGRGIPVSINLSVNQFKQENFVKVVRGIVEASGIDPRYVVFELTESIFAGDVASAEEIISELKSSGYAISIDDFGTGYSSLSYLKRLKVNNLKIDISFVREINRDPDSASIVTAIISMAHNLGLKTIAEGVETEEQFNILRILKCDYIQGYYMSKPLPAGEAEKLLQGADRGE